MGNNFDFSLRSKADIDELFLLNSAFFGYGSGVPYARVVELFGKAAADYALPYAIVRVIPATEPGKENEYFTFYPERAFHLAAARANMATERARVARLRELKEMEKHKEETA